jgi:hypothetical protein
MTQDTGVPRQSVGGYALPPSRLSQSAVVSMLRTAAAIARSAS